MVGYKDPDLTSSHGHSKAKLPYTTYSENDPATGRTNLHGYSQREFHIQKGRRVGDVVGKGVSPALQHT